MPSTPLTYFLWIFIPLVQVALLVVLRKRKLYEDHSMFFTYTLFQVIAAVLDVIAFKFAGYETYFYVYWVRIALSIGLGFFVIKEVFTNMLKPYAGLRDAGILLFRWAAAVLILISVLSYVSGTGNGAARILREVVTMERNVRFIQCGLLLFVVMCSNYIGFSWRSLSSGIAFGFGFFAAVDLLISNALMTRGYFFSQETASLAGQVAYACAVIMWFTYSMLPQPEQKAVHAMAYRPVVDRWNQAAMLLMNTGASTAPAPQTYLSDIERTVEAVLAHSTAK
jgi:hypothetical protein